jgi:hypothetical protein
LATASEFGQLVEVAPLLFPVAVPALINLSELSWISPVKPPLLKRLMLTCMPLMVASEGIAKPKLVAFNACENAVPTPATVVFELLLLMIFPGLLQAVPVPLVAPVPAKFGPTVTGLADVQVDDAVNAALAVPWQMVTPVNSGTGLIVNTLVDVALAHGELAIAVNVSVTVPAAISAGLGSYVASVNELASVNVPVPLDVQVTLASLLALEPDVILTAPELAQVLKAEPAVAVGAAVMLIVFVEVTLAQPALPIAVSTSVLLPAVLSAALGLYVAVVNEVEFANVPVPFDVVQVILAWLVALEPAVIFTAPEAEQVNTSVPAFAVGNVFIVSVLLDVALVAQGEFGVAVNVSVTLPAAISAGLGS